MMTTRTRDLLIGLTALAVAALLVASQIVGCAASKTQPTARVRPSPTRALEPGGLTDADCLALLDRRDGAQLAGKILAGVGGVAALGTAPDAVPEGARWGIGAGAATAAAVGLRRVAAALNAAGYRSRAGRPFQAAQVREMVRDPDRRVA